MLPLLALPVVALQGLHLWLLGRVWPRHRRRLLLGLAGLHLLLLPFPLALHTGLVGLHAQLALRTLGHLVVGFQLLTGFHLALTALQAGWATSRRHPVIPTPRRTLGALAVALGLTLGLWSWGPRTCASPQLRTVEIALPDLPAGLEGLRIAHLSDLHAGPHVDASLLRRWRAMAEAERPDLLLFTGDFVDARPEEIAAVSEAFRDFPAPLGRFAVLGNHDHLLDSRPIAAGLRAAGIDVVDNEARALVRGATPFTLFGL